MPSNKNKGSKKGQNSSSSREMAGSAATGSTATTSNGGKKRKVWARTMNISNNSDAASNETPTSLDITSDNGYTLNITANPTGGNRTANTSNSAQNNSTDRIPSGDTEVKISFGPSRPPTTSSSCGGGKNKNSSSNINHHQQTSHLPSSSAAAAASMASMMGSGNGNISFGDLDLETLKEKAAAAASGQKTFRNKHGLPCTEAEMKALMSMFVEIMGMSMNNNNKGGGSENAAGVGTFNAGSMVYRSSDDSDFHQSNSGNSNPGSSHRNAGGPVFSFGANPMDASTLAAVAAAASGSSSGMIPDHMAAATAGFFADGASWEALRRTYAAAELMAATEDDDEDDESFENRELTFEELEFLLHHRKQKEEAAKLASQFASGDWESLEQVAINDHLLSETDDKERKAAKKREKKQRRKAKLKEEAAQKAAEAAQKKREKAIVSWRSRVVSACQSNEITKLDGLLQESPLQNLVEVDVINNNHTDVKSYPTTCIISHLEFLLPNSVAKNRAQVERGIESRLRLAEYILHTELSLAFKPLRTGRTALHTACFHGDVRFLKLLFDKIESYTPKKEENPLSSSFLDLTCDESGWSPLHYASVSGSLDIMELLLAKGSDLSTRTDVTHTWRESDGRGLTPRELVQYVQSGNYEEFIETHGLALQEMTNAFFNHHQERRIFTKKLDRVHQRLSNVEKNGYTPLSKDKADSMIDYESQTEDAVLNRPESSSSRNKKKKKKKKKQNGKDAESRTAANTGANQKNSDLSQSNSIESKEEKDPLVTALLGMGFNEDQIMSAVKVCGGTHRATADDLVTWILGQGDNEESLRESQNSYKAAERMQQGRDQNDLLQKENLLGSDEQEHRRHQLEVDRQKEETARRLAVKREEARRRNREWNNREQARQEKEAKAKVAKKVYGVSQSSISVTVPATGPDASSKSITRPRLPNGIHTSHTTGKIIAGMKSSSRHPQTGNMWGVPPVTSQSQSFSRPTSQSNVAPYITNSAAPTLVTTNAQHVLPVSSFFASINDDDKTVSSFGSSRGVSVSSKDLLPLASHPSVPPPGFTPTATQPIAALTRPAVATVPENPSGPLFSDNLRQGEIRATAKEFVPLFTVPDIGTSDESLEKEPTPSNDRSASQSGQSYDVGFPPGILPQQGRFADSHDTILGSSLQNTFQNSFDNVPSIAPPSMESITLGASFNAGSKTQESAMTIPFEFKQGESKESNVVGGSRLLNSISRNSSVGSTSIWGERQSIPSLESKLHPSFFGDGAGDEKNTTSWHIPTGSNSTIPNSSGQGSIW